MRLALLNVESPAAMDSTIPKIGRHGLFADFANLKSLKLGLSQFEATKIGREKDNAPAGHVFS